jgi:NAD dependent epimerase/dehydratase family enzyme
MFDYRHRTTLADLEFHRRYRQHPRIKVAVTDADSALGSALVALLETGGHEVVRLSRTTRAIGNGEVNRCWANGTPSTAELEGIDALVDFSDELGKRRRTASGGDEFPDELWAAVTRLSRPPSVRVVVSTLAAREHDPPPIRSVSIVDSEATTGGMDSADGSRVVVAQLGLILSPRQGILARLLPLFQIGLGGRIPGSQGQIGWIAIDDAAAALAHILLTPDLRGRVGIVSPHPCRAVEFGPRLARVLKRPSALPLSSSLLRLLIGESDLSACLGGDRIQPRKLLDSGFRFRYATLEAALEHMLGKTR